MSIFRVQDKTPEVYTSTSRDFQLIGRLYDCIINGVKFDTDSILDIINTDNIDSRLLKLLQTKIGFFSSKDITDESLRYVLKAFPEIVKHKGSIKSIKQAVCTFLKLNGIKSFVYVNKINNSLSKPYTIEIGIDSSIKDTYVLDQILKYILPTGYAISYFYYNSYNRDNMILESKIDANIVILKDSVSSLIRGNYISYRNQTEDYLIGSIGETQVSSPYDTTYMGSLNNEANLPVYTINESAHVGEMYSVIGDESSRYPNIKFYIYELDHDDGQYKWNEIESNRSYNVFDSSLYGYYDSATDNFYSVKSSSYLEDQAYLHNGLYISGSSTPDNAIVSTTNQNLYLVDDTYNLIWDVDSENNRWVSHRLNEFGEKFSGGDPNSDMISLIPKMNSKILRNAFEEYNVEKKIWVSEIGEDNEYVWVDYNGDIDQSLITSIISDEPYLTKIIENRDNFIYSNDAYWCKNQLNNLWETANIVHINGNPNYAVNIIPDANVHIYNDSKSWTASINDYSEVIQPLSNKILYIDINTSNGYRYDSVTNSFEEVMHFIKASNVYEIDAAELEYLIENRLIEPAFRDNNTIFTDKFGNLFLL